MKKIVKNLLLAFITSLILVSTTVTTQAATTKSVTPKLAYTIKGLNHNLNVQNFYVGSSY